MKTYETLKINDIVFDSTFQELSRLKRYEPDNKEGHKHLVEVLRDLVIDSKNVIKELLNHDSDIEKEFSLIELSIKLSTATTNEQRENINKQIHSLLYE